MKLLKLSYIFFGALAAMSVASAIWIIFFADMSETAYLGWPSFLFFGLILAAIAAGLRSMHKSKKERRNRKIAADTEISSE